MRYSLAKFAWTKAGMTQDLGQTMSGNSNEK